MSEVNLNRRILAANDAGAGKNRAFFEKHGVLVVNVMSSPGAGKTTLLEATVRALHPRVRLGVVEGDIATSLDAERLARLGIPAVQINTAGACHLDAGMIAGVRGRFDWERLDALFIENVGNLVCPAGFDLGEDLRTVILSIPEGSDKFRKYPAIFRDADILLLSKVDLLPFSDFDVELLLRDAAEARPELPVMPVSAIGGEGVDRWAEWLEERIRQKKAGKVVTT